MHAKLDDLFSIDNAHPVQPEIGTHPLKKVEADLRSKRVKTETYPSSQQTRHESQPILRAKPAGSMRKPRGEEMPAGLSRG